MDEATLIIVLTSLVQTIVITLTLLVFIFQFRSQEKAIKESSYQNLMGRYNDFIMTQAENPEINKIVREQIYAEIGDTKTAGEDPTVYLHLLIVYGIIEEAFLLYAKKWIDQERWDQWAVWLKSMARHPQFAEIHRRTRGMFDKGFENFVSKVLEEGTGSES